MTHWARPSKSTLDSAFGTAQAVAESGDGNCVRTAELTEDPDSEVNDEANRVLVLINEAIESQKFMLLFQPIISLRGDSDEHYEVFLRMMDRNGEQMAPGEFLRTAIENGVAGKIDRWVILQSIKMLSTHRAKGHNTRLTINVTSNSVADGEFIQWLASGHQSGTTAQRRGDFPDHRNRREHLHPPDPGVRRRL